MCVHCERGVPWIDKNERPIYQSSLTYDSDGWHVDCEDSIIGTISAPIEFCPKCGEKLPEGGRGF